MNCTWAFCAKNGWNKMGNNILPLPVGYTARGGRMEDYKIACDLLNVHSQHLNGRDDLAEPELLRLDWLNGAPPVHPWIFGCVDPAHWGKGVGGNILTWAHDHARLALEICQPDLRVAPRSGIEAHNQAGLALFQRWGWKHIRSYYRMIVDLDSVPEMPPLPEGITIRPYNPETETETVYLTYADSFKDHFGFIVPPFEKGFAEFKHNLINEPGYDPRLWFVAVEGDEIAGICICRREDPESGWVNKLGVRPNAHDLSRHALSQCTPPNWRTFGG